MENSYGIGITNRYACFIDDDDGGDPIEILKQVQNEKKAKKVEAAPKANAKAPAKKDNKKDDSDNKENRTGQKLDGKRVLDARKPQEGPREERNNRINQEGGARRDVDDEGRGRGRGGRGGRGMGGRGRGGGGGGDGAPRGGGPPRDGYRGGKREFERKSGDNRTGIKAEDKRGGGGKGNWGTMEDELKGETEEGNVTLDENGAPKEEGEKTGGEESGAEEKAKEEEQPKQLTLDEWKAMQNKRDEPKFNVRRAGEGADIDPKWKKAAAYKKEKVDEDSDEEDDQFVYSQRANRLKHMNVDLHFADQQSPRGGGGGGRGRGRGGRGGRGGRAPREGEQREGGGRRDKVQQFSLDDKDAFPALM